MTEREAQRLAHEFHGTEIQARRFADALNAQMDPGPDGPMVTVDLGGLWVVMLHSAAELLREIDLV